MADNEAVDVDISGGVNGDSVDFDDSAPMKTQAKENFSDGHYLKARIDELEQEKRELKVALEKMEEEKLEAVMKTETADAERNELEMKAMESITKRAFELEGEVVRLQHDLGSALNSGDDASREVERLTREIDELKKEKSALLEKVSEQAEELKRLNSDSRSKIVDLEKQIEALTEAKKAVSLSEETAKARLNELEREISQVKEEKTSVQNHMASLSDKYKSSEMAVIDLYKTIQNLTEKAYSNEKTTDEPVEKAGFSVSIPVAGAVSAGVIVAALTVCYINFNRTR